MRNVTRNSNRKPKSVVSVLLNLLVLVFVLQRVSEILFGYELDRELAFSVRGIKSFKLWQLVSYAFLHEGFLHLFFNALLISFFGKNLERMCGPRRVIEIFLFTVVTSALFFGVVHHNDPYCFVIGASGGALGIFTYFCLVCENHPLTFLLFFFFPITAKPRTILAVSLGFEVFYLLTQEIYGAKIASSAHVGGILGAIIYFYCYKKYTQKFRSGKVISEKTTESYSIYLTCTSPQKQEIDRILDKINQSGFSSLTESEKKTLDSAKHFIRQ